MSLNEDMISDWTKWINNYVLPDSFYWYKMDGKLIYSLTGYHIVETNYLYLTDKDNTIVRGIRLDNLLTEQELRKAIDNEVLKLQVDLKSPKSYTTYKFGSKQVIIAP